MVFPFPPSSPFISFLVSFFLLLFALETLDENGRDMWDDRYGVSGLGSRIRCDLNAREKEMEREGDGRHYLLFFFSMLLGYGCRSIPLPAVSFTIGVV